MPFISLSRLVSLSEVTPALETGGVVVGALVVGVVLTGAVLGVLRFGLAAGAACACCIGVKEHRAAIKSQIAPVVWMREAYLCGRCCVA